MTDVTDVTDMTETENPLVVPGKFLNFSETLTLVLRVNPTNFQSLFW